MKQFTQLTAYRKVRFVIVGIGNTVFNFAVLNFCFYVLGQGKIVSSIIATICAVILSFFFNRNFVFKHTGRSWRQPILFAAVTLSGVLLLQNSVYALLVFLLRDYMGGISNAIHSLTRIRLGNDFLLINLSNAAASLCTMLWNYNGYRLLVFKDNLRHEVQAEAA